MLNYPGSVFFLLSGGRAYLDPGSGSMLLQIILAGLLAAGILIRTQWSKVKSLFQRGHSTPPEEGDEETE
jgi:hypothetical protein